MPGLLRGGYGKQVTIDNINKNIARVELTLEGPVYQRALELRDELSQGVNKPFADVLEATTGDLSALGQGSITFIRQITALACFPELLNDSVYPDDVKTRVKDFLQNCQGNSIGALADTAGLEIVRRHVAKFIENRDNFPAHWEDIIIVPGVSATVKILRKLLNYSSNGLPARVMVPCPQFPVLSEAFADCGVEKVGYYLDEELGWSVNKDELKQVFSEGNNAFFVRALVVVNPGNPTGQVLSKENIEKIIKFAHKEKLLIIAYEVFQDVVYEDHEFHSFKKVLSEMGAPYNHTELVSFMSYFNGCADESGVRGGSLELFNISPDLKAMVKSAIMISDSTPVCAQIALDCVTNPPQLGEPSYPVYQRERAAFIASSAERAKAMYVRINAIPGLSCQPIQSAFFAFVKVEIPEKAIFKANTLNQCPSTWYVLEMLEKAGVVTVAGEGLGQKPGTFHFRISTMLTEDKMQLILQRIEDFHINFMDEYK